MVPAGAVCAVHPDTPATATCKRCGSFACNSCAVFDPDGTVICASCVPKGAAALPWEKRRELGFFRAWWQTTKAVMFHPQEALRGPPTDLGYGSPLLFAIVAHTIGAFFAVFWQLAFTGLMFAMTGLGRGEVEVLLPQVGLQGAMLVVMPLLAVVWVFVIAAVLHLCLMMFGGARAGFDATMRVVAYCGATSFCGIVPFLGSTIAAVWFIVAAILGLAAAHGTSTGRSAGAVLLPVALCCLGVLMMLGMAAYSLARVLD